MTNPPVNLAESALQAARNELRRTMRQFRRDVPEAERRAADRALCRSLATLPELRQGGAVAGYCAIDGEPDLQEFYRQLQAWGVALFLPRYQVETDGYEMVEIKDLEQDLTPGRYHIPEPAAHLQAVDTEFCRTRLHYLIPGVAFDRAMHRLGRGKGYYDRLLAGVTGLRIGVCYEGQMVDRLAIQPHDQAMTLIVTEQSLYNRPRENQSGADSRRSKKQGNML